MGPNRSQSSPPIPKNRRSRRVARENESGENLAAEFVITPIDVLPGMLERDILARNLPRPRTRHHRTDSTGQALGTRIAATGTNERPAAQILSFITLS